MKGHWIYWVGHIYLSKNKKPKIKILQFLNVPGLM